MDNLQITSATYGLLPRPVGRPGSYEPKDTGRGEYKKNVTLTALIARLEELLKRKKRRTLIYTHQSLIPRMRSPPPQPPLQHQCTRRTMTKLVDQLTASPTLPAAPRASSGTTSDSTTQVMGPRPREKKETKVRMARVEGRGRERFMEMARERAERETRAEEISKMRRVP
jgi:hypothetical protein